jgi:hypothetical protein
MIAYVNGYVCTTPCEAAAARKGKDPFAPPGTPPDQAKKNDKTPGIDGQPATTFGRVLANLSQTNAITPTGAPSPSNQPVLNILV